VTPPVDGESRETAFYIKDSRPGLPPRPQHKHLDRDPRPRNAAQDSTVAAAPDRRCDSSDQNRQRDARCESSEQDRLRDARRAAREAREQERLDQEAEEIQRYQEQVSKNQAKLARMRTSHEAHLASAAYEQDHGQETQDSFYARQDQDPDDAQEYADGAVPVRRFETSSASDGRDSVAGSGWRKKPPPPWRDLLVSGAYAIAPTPLLIY
jgi:hypothetical protein